ncbi:hypothetical protein TRP8649_00555 [Pelagimonas phthalicica]|uniref:Uncharacterized protein n=1 Tax=Pelagimonas phthalicica TaxID=1037362 RepID=A0A238J9D1_9RHOB|nr:hypothetical protein [Pelagimonas phthalicica]TDS94998.1 hypothetical protein CLV87_1517 [Pelagimonas phthalicica]SMX26476.1 hypothetical protein TRP8649_00555 [Pelagimonas phthalicica]
MESNVLIAFGMTFVVGPVLAALLLRMPPRVWVIALLAVGVVGATFVANWLTSQSQMSPYASLAAMWLAWVLAVSMVGLALRKRIENPRLRRWVTLVTLLATTLPWFGLATAQIISG